MCGARYEAEDIILQVGLHQKIKQDCTCCCNDASALSMIAMVQGVQEGVRSMLIRLPTHVWASGECCY